MKRSILIIYNPFIFQSMINATTLYEKTVKAYQKSGQDIATKRESVTRFSDGLIVEIAPITNNFKGHRVTHLYIENQVTQIEQGQRYVAEVLTPMVIGEQEYGTGADSRIFLFNNNNHVKKFYNE